VNEHRLRAELRRTRPPDAAETQQRARAVVLAAYDGARASAGTNPPPPPRRRVGAALPVAVALLLALVGGAVAATPPGEAVTDWVRDLLGRSSPAPEPAPALTRLPGDGRVLVAGASGAWIVHADGSRRRLGAYDEATWSPRGLFVGAVRGRQLVALDSGGDVRWALARPDRVHDPRWAPSGFRVAYRSGSSLRVVAGDGSADRLVADRVAPVAAAWRPAEGRNELAYVDGAGRVVVVDADSGRTLARLRPGVTPRRLQWTPSGERLLASGVRGVRLLSMARSARTLATATTGTEFADTVLSPDGRRIALLRRSTTTARAEVLVTKIAGRPRSLFGAAGPIRSLTWSPGGRLILADWAGADQWLFLPAHAGARASAVAGIAAQFDLSRAHPRRGINVEGWCCS